MSANMTELEKMLETFSAAFDACPSTLAEDSDRAGIRAVLEKHIQPLLAEAYFEGLADGEEVGKNLDHKAYAAAIIKQIIGET